MRVKSVQIYLEINRTAPFAFDRVGPVASRRHASTQRTNKIASVPGFVYEVGNKAKDGYRQNKADHVGFLSSM